MEFQRILNLLDTTSDDKDLPRFINKNGLNCMINQRKLQSQKKIRIKTQILRSDLCNYSDVYIAVKGYAAVTNLDYEKSVASKKNAPFINWILKISGVGIDNAEDLDVVMPMYNFVTKKQHEACAIITEMNQVISFLLILNHLNTRQVLQEILIILMMMKVVMMQTKLIKRKLNLLFH